MAELLILRDLMNTNCLEADDDLLEAVLKRCSFNINEAVATLSEMGFELPEAEVDEERLLSRELSEAEEHQKTLYSASLNEHAFRTRVLKFENAAGPNPKEYTRLFLPVQKGYGGAIVGSKYIFSNKIIERARDLLPHGFPHAHLIIKFLDEKVLEELGIDSLSCLMIEGVHKDQAERTQELLLDHIAKILNTFQDRSAQSPPLTSPSEAIKDSSGQRSNSLLRQVDVRGLNALHAEEMRHIFVDNSNLFIGAQNRTGSFDGSVRINVGQLARLLATDAKGRELPGARVVAGSRPAGAGAAAGAGTGVWEKWEASGFRTDVTSRGPAGGEQHVDEFLHAQVRLVAHACMLATSHDRAFADDVVPIPVLVAICGRVGH
jgi:hypothetical protein